ncbi:MAG TPA: class I SAM-dependent methyltransferase, partial [Terrimicrobiaceae bacterium]|nr:class I SAM-dependent methyltransferase [Terrimicrobiaceae bacterium]
MGWEIRDFYTQKSEWFGPTGIFPEHRERASLVGRLCGPGRKRILELGAGSGGTASAMAEHSHTVVAVEFSPLRVAFARELAKGHRNLKILEADFYKVKLSSRFDVVCFWDSFGMGSDADQRRLLRRVGREW